MCKFIETDCRIRIPVDLYGKFGTYTLFPKEGFVSFEEAKKFMRELDIKGCKEWYEYSKSGKRPKVVSWSLIFVLSKKQEFL